MFSGPECVDVRGIVLICLGSILRPERKAPLIRQLLALKGGALPDN